MEVRTSVLEGVVLDAAIYRRVPVLPDGWRLAIAERLWPRFAVPQGLASQARALEGEAVERSKHGNGNLLRPEIPPRQRLQFFVGDGFDAR